MDSENSAVYHASDIYKKRGFGPLEIKELVESGEHNGITSLSKKIRDIESSIRAQQRVLKRLDETKIPY